MTAEPNREQRMGQTPSRRITAAAAAAAAILAVAV
jgi:hypothetical protein